MILHMILLVIFLIMGVFGLIFNVPEGVFVGAALVPWEVRMVLANRGRMNMKLVMILLGISAVVGVGYFVIHHHWGRGLVLLGVQAYIYFVVNKSKAKLDKEIVEKDTNK